MTSLIYRILYNIKECFAKGCYKDTVKQQVELQIQGHYKRTNDSVHLWRFQFRLTESTTR